MAERGLEMIVKCKCGYEKKIETPAGLIFYLPCPKCGEWLMVKEDEDVSVENTLCEGRDIKGRNV